jgi:hypothetical protein
MAYFAKIEDFQSEGDVEMKLVTPLLLNKLGLGYFNEDVKNKSYMAPTTIDKGAGKTRGYYPDYSIVLNSLPVMVVEVKDLHEKVEEGFREGQLYAQEVNKRWRTGFNPVGLVVACNGHSLMYGPWDSEEVTRIDVNDLVPGAALFEEFRSRCQRSTLLDKAQQLRKRIRPERSFKAMNLLGGPYKQDQTLAANQFARELAPIFREFFDTGLGRTDPVILKRAYVATAENTHYDGILESLLRDNLARHKHPDFELIETTRKDVPALDVAISNAISRSKTTAPMILLIGGVGGGKSIFLDKYLQGLMGEALRRRTLLVVIDFNAAPENLASLDDWIVESALDDLPTRNGVTDFKHYDNLHKYFGLEIKELRDGQHKRLADTQPEKYQDKIDEHVSEWVDDKGKFLKAAVQHYGFARAMTVLVVFDNADRRDAEQQLKIFQAVQHFRHSYKCFTILSLRDETYHRYKSEPPLDAFYKPFLFMIQPARFLDIARERLNLVIEDLASKAPRRSTYTLSSGAVVEFPASELGEYLVRIYNSLFNPRKKTRYLFESLAGRNMRTALEMFAEIVMSPHFETDKIFATRFKTAPDELDDWMIIRILMKRKYAYYKDRDGNHINNIFAVNEKSASATVFLLAILLRRLSNDRKTKGELNIEGYRHVSKLIEEVSNQGFIAEDVLWGLERLLRNKMIVADHQRTEGIDRGDYVKITASGHYHLTWLLLQPEYINNVSMDTWVQDEDTAARLKELGDLKDDSHDVNFDRIYRKLSEFRNAIYGEADIHAEQATIQPGENEALNLVVRSIDRAAIQ